MHPVVIMAHEKSEALDAAKKSLEEAGLKVKVLMTGTAKLVDFLGALADAEAEEAPAEETPPEEPEDKPAEETPPEEPEDKPKMEALVDGEKIVVEVTTGGCELFPSGLLVGKKTIYTINESTHSFWPDLDSGDQLWHDVQVQIGKQARWIRVNIREAAPTPVLKISQEMIDEFLK